MDKFFLDTNVILASSITGTINDIEKKVQHSSHIQTVSIFEYLKVKNEESINLGYITPKVENESRKYLFKAIKDTIEENWPKMKRNKNTSKSKNILNAEKLHSFSLICKKNLNNNLELLVRLPISEKKVIKILKNIDCLFNELEVDYQNQLNVNEWEMNITSPKFRNLKKKTRAISGDFLSNDIYRPSIENSDKRILAEIKVTGIKNPVFYSMDNHFVSEWAKKAIRDNLVIFCKHPSEFK